MNINCLAVAYSLLPGWRQQHTEHTSAPAPPPPQPSPISPLIIGPSRLSVCWWIVISRLFLPCTNNRFHLLISLFPALIGHNKSSLSFLFLSHTTTYYHTPLHKLRWPWLDTGAAADRHRQPLETVTSATQYSQPFHLSPSKLCFINWSLFCLASQSGKSHC